MRALIAAMQAQDAAAIRAQFALTATQAYGADGMKAPAATAKWLESDIIKRQGMVAGPEFTVNGNEVVVRGQYNSKGYSSKANFLFTVENGLIASSRMLFMGRRVPDLSEHLRVPAAVAAVIWLRLG